MAIGPEATRMASGRIIVVAGFYGLLGGAATILGMGPLIRPADVTVRALAIVTVGAGLVLLVGAIGLLARRGWGRRAGVIAGWSALGLGMLTTVLALGTLISCAGPGLVAGCTILVGGLSLVGVTIIISAIASIAVVRRARPSVFTRRR